MSADDLVLCGEAEENLRAMVGRFAEVCRRERVKVNAGKSKVMVLNGEKVVESEVHKCCRKKESGRKVAGAIRSLVNARD